MSRTPKHNPKNETPHERPMKKSSFVTEMEMQRQERISSIHPSKRELSFSTFLDLYPDQSKGNFLKPHFRKETTQKMQDTDDDLKRARSVKVSVLNKPIVETVEKNIESQLNENVIRLKMEEMTFKYKSKISNLLKQLDVPSHELSRFNSIVRVDDILNFLAEKVRQKIVNTQINEAKMNKVISKQKGTLNQYEIEIEALARKLKDRQTSERSLKIKVKQLHTESQQLLQKLSLKEKQLSTKITELYQAKTNLKDNEKTYDNLKHRYDILQKEVIKYRSQLEEDNKGIFSNQKQLKEQNTNLQDKVQELEEQLKNSRDKQSTLGEINSQLTQELTRWRQRFEDIQFQQSQTKKSSESNGQVETVYLQTRKGMRQSTMSMNINSFQDSSAHPRSSFTGLQIQNMKLQLKVEQLQKKNKQLSRDVLNSATIKQRYEKTLGAKGEQKSDIWQSFDSQKSISLNSKERDQYIIEMDNHYKKKIEDMAQEWKQKLYEIVQKYEDQLQLTKQKSGSFSSENEKLEKKVKQLAVDKYQLQNKVITLQKQVYELLKMYKSTSKRFQDSIRVSQQQKSRKSSFASMTEHKSEEEQEPSNTVNSQNEA